MQSIHNIRIISSNEQQFSFIKSLMNNIGVSQEGINQMLPKSIFYCILLEKVDYRAANILKQEMLSFGGEVCLNKNVITGNIKKTNLLILGTLKQINNLLKILQIQPFGLKIIAQEIKKSIKIYEQKKIRKIKCGSYFLEIGKKTLVMGILNVTPDSFSDGNLYLKKEKAINHALEMIEQGADIIDIGGESSRPGAKKISEKEELKRIIPIIETLSKKIKIPISIDTYKAKVAEEAIKSGASLINDISALQFDEKLKEVIAKYKIPVILMHMQKTPETMQKNPSYQDVISDILRFFREQIEIVEKSGICQENIIIDPGIGFGKTYQHNLEIIKRLKEFKILNKPILIGPSRKSFIGQTLDLPPNERLEGTAAIITTCVLNGADIIRVHDVKEMKRIVKMTKVIK